MDNQKHGYFAIFRSLLSSDWAKDTAKLSLWIRLLSQASRNTRTVSFNNTLWDLEEGQLVTKIELLTKVLSDSEGGLKSRDQVKRMLDFFVRQGMISYSGNRHGTVITVLNYAEYQGDLPAHKFAHNTAHNKLSDINASRGTPAHNSAHKPAQHEQECIKQELNNNTPISPEGSDSVAQEPKPEKPKSTRKKSSAVQFDHQRFIDTWNCKAEKFGLPKILLISKTTLAGLTRLYDSHVAYCKQTGCEPADVDTMINGYIEFGYTPTEWACGKNPTGKKYGIETALTQKMIDSILTTED